jgi:hypothetical protein
MDDLRQLMAAYFHQDWWEEYGGAWESAVDDFARREPHRIAGAADEITTLLTSADSDEAVGRALDDLGNFRDPGPAPDAHAAWLREVRDRLITSAGYAQRTS